jgi:hypothetical protein
MLETEKYESIGTDSEYGSNLSDVQTQTRYLLCGTGIKREIVLRVVIGTVVAIFSLVIGVAIGAEGISSNECGRRLSTWCK